MAVVDVADIEARSVTRQTTGSKGGQLALVRDLGERVDLVHELRELAAAEELLHGGDDRADVYQRGGRGLLRVGDRHALAHHALHAQEADAELVLHQLAHRAHPAVAQVVDVVRGAPAVVDHDDPLHDRHEVLAAQGADLRRVDHAEALVQLVAADTAQVVAAVGEEQRLQQLAGVVRRGRVAGAQAAVELLEGFRAVLRRVLRERRLDVVVILVRVDLGQHRAHAVVRADLRLVEVVIQVNGAQEDGHRDAALAVDLDRHHVLGVGLELQPGAAVRDQLRSGEATAGGRVVLSREVRARRADELRHHDALGAVDQERAVLGHHGHVAHEQRLLLDLAGLLDEQLDGDAQRRGVGALAVAALRLRVLGLLEVVVAEAQLHAATREVLDRRHLVEELAQPLAQEAVVRPSGHIDEVRHLHDVPVRPEALFHARYAAVGDHNSTVSGHRRSHHQSRSRGSAGRRGSLQYSSWVRPRAGCASRLDLGTV